MIEARLYSNNSVNMLWNTYSRVNCTEHVGFSRFDSSNIVRLLCVSISVVPQKRGKKTTLIRQVDEMEHLIRSGFGIKEPPAVTSTQGEEMLKMQKSRFAGKRWTLVQKVNVCVLVFGLNWHCVYVLLTVLFLICGLLASGLGTKQKDKCITKIYKTAFNIVKPHVEVSS